MAAVILGARTPSEIGERASLSPDETATALTRLLRAGVIATQDDDGFVLLDAIFAAAVRAEGKRAPVAGYDGLDPAMAKVLRTYLVDGRLVSIPVAGRKRRAVLERYTELQVNAILRVWHDDVAALRRYLVDEALMDRADGEYWRIGGWLELA